MKLWNVLVRKSAKTKTDSNCKNCKKFDNNSNSDDDHHKNNSGYYSDNQSTSIDFTNRINDQFDRKIFKQHDLHSLTNYSISKSTDDGSVIIGTKITNVMIDCSDGSLGITLKATAFDKTLSISHIEPHGPVFRNGLIHTGDRLLQVDDYPLHLSDSLIESKQILKDKLETCPKFLMLTIEYNVNVLKSVELSSDAFVIEIQRTEPQCHTLGLILNHKHFASADQYCSPPFTSGIFIEHLLAASLSDRSGALKVGDQILMVDSIEIEQSGHNAGQVTHLIDQGLQQNGYVTLRILPKHLAPLKRTHNIYHNSSKYVTSRQIEPRKHYQSTSSSSNSYTTKQSAFGHSETIVISLNYDNNYQFGYGLNIILPESPEDVNVRMNPTIKSINVDSPAYLCGCLQVGDRIKSINNQSYWPSLSDIDNTLSNAQDTLLMEIEFDVADTVIPDSGIFTVKLPRIGPDLGFTISLNKNSVFTITQIRKGSAAYRAGILSVGDRLLAINDSLINQLNFEQLMNLVSVQHDSDNVQDHVTTTDNFVSLRVQKFEQSSDSAEYSVNLCNSGPLGITISGSEDCTEPITLARLTKNGPAERMGQLQIGDRIIAINNISVINKPLSEAINLLKSSPDQNVNIKLLRKNGRQRHDSERTYSRILYSDDDTEDNLSLSTDAALMTTAASEPVEIYQIQLTKDAVYDDYGFSVSDGLYKKGVYINRIRKGGPADLSRMLKRFDRIIQVNDVNTQDFDCCLTVPLIASAGELINLTISRYSNLNINDFGEQEGGKLAKRYDTISPSLISTNSSNAARNLTAVAVTAAMNNSNSTTSSLTFIL